MWIANHHAGTVTRHLGYFRESSLLGEATFSKVSEGKKSSSIESRDRELSSKTNPTSGLSKTKTTSPRISNPMQRPSLESCADYIQVPKEVGSFAMAMKAESSVADVKFTRTTSSSNIERCDGSFSNFVHS